MDEARIVIGFDGSDFAGEALRKGLWLASKVGDRPRRTCLDDQQRAAPETWAPGYVPPVEDFAEAVIEQLTALTPSVAEFPDVPVSSRCPMVQRDGN